MAVKPISLRIVGRKTGKLEKETLHEKYMSCIIGISDLHRHEVGYMLTAVSQFLTSSRASLTSTQLRLPVRFS